MEDRVSQETGLKILSVVLLIGVAFTPLLIFVPFFMPRNYRYKIWFGQFLVTFVLATIIFVSVFVFPS